ncbi:hypothetical protein [Enhygromyxa salina]|uniref:hypothetical protein n=1 Tax=Enhygromyxa salina TaxID=215803 RepID=UPI0011B1DB1B|nr:hypothetical protein [Enhygromyxa salina]
MGTGNIPSFGLALAIATSSWIDELRNIHGGSPLGSLGLRDGDRRLAMSPSQAAGRLRGRGRLERVVVALARRGRPISPVYASI